MEDQVRLPIDVAAEVVLQGIRIRFGRSLVTIFGVVFGIAFLMSVLTSQLIREGVAGEEVLRIEVKRMMSFLTADTGLPVDQTYGVVACGPLDPAEGRLLERLLDEGAKGFRWSGPVPTEPAIIAATTLELTGLDAIARHAQAVLVMGAGPVPEALFDVAGDGAGAAPLAFTRGDAVPAHAEGAPLVRLAREQKPEEVERAALEARRQRTRNIWIVIASLVVTVIGISNAMLMSVTERFREIGTMKCLGALSAFIRRIFLIESGLMGVVGATAGALTGALFSIGMYSVAYGPATVLGAIAAGRLLLYLATSVLAGMLLSMLAAIYPASVAARMVPSHALRTNV